MKHQQSNSGLDVRMDELHFRRYKIERRRILNELEDVKTLADDNTLVKKSWDTMDLYFSSYSERERLEVVGREGDYLEALRIWEQHGSAIFALNSDLVSMFLHSDVAEIPIKSLNMPYPSIYCYLGDSDPFPNLHPDYRVDGFYLWADPTDLAFWTHEPAPDVDKLRKNLRIGLDVLLDAVRHPDNHNEKYVKYCRDHLEASGGAENYVEFGITEAIKRWEEKEARYNSFLTDPDSFDYWEGGYHHYLGLHLDFTLAPKDGSVRARTAEELIGEPFLHAYYDFETHQYTVKEAIESGYHDGTYAMEHHIGDRDIDPFDEMVIEPADERYVDARETLPDGHIRGSLHRLDSYLNVTNRPDLLDDMTRLAFNTLCYLNWKDRDVMLRYPNQKLNVEEDTAKTQKAKKKAAFKARSAGYRKLYFCGFSSTSATGKTFGGVAGTIKSHWRRGHWRNQPFGKGLRDSKLIWIKPVIVAKSEQTPTEPTLYHLEKRTLSG